MRIADSVKPEAVVQVLDMLKSAGLHVTLDGGWGVDALLGRITRAHEVWGTRPIGLYPERNGAEIGFQTFRLITSWAALGSVRQRDCLS